MDGATRRTVLVVEDDPDVRSLAAALLEETEFDVVEVENGDKALDYLGRHAPEVAVVFTDVTMPGRVDGLELARTAAARWPWVKAVITSGDRGRARDLPPSATFMPKPWRALDVLMAVDKATLASA